MRDEQCAAYEEYLYGLGLAPKTIDVYARHVHRATLWANSRGGRVVDLTAREVAEFTSTVPNSASTRRHLRTALTHYWRMRGRRDAPVRAVRVPPKPRGRSRALEIDDARALVKAAIGWHPEGLAVLFGMYMALRRAEIATTRWDRFSPDLDWYTVIGKGDVEATLPVHPALRDELVLHRSAYVWLFPGSRNRAHVTPTTVWLWTRKVGSAAGIGDRLTTHELRHTALATANDATGDLRATQAFARHARPETTAIYTRATTERLTAVVNSLDYG